MRKIEKALSKRDGIIFYSSNVPSMAVETTINEKGEFESKVIPRGFLDFMEFLGFYTNDSYATSVKLDKKVVYSFYIALIIVCFWNFGFSIGLAAIYFALTMQVENLGFILAVFKIKFGKEKSISRFHAAEHMAINAYNSLGRIPTIDEIKNFSRLSKHCGSEYYFRIIFISISFTILIGISANNFLLYISILISAITILILERKYKILRFMQFFVTNKPTDLELRLAIKGLDELEKFDKEFEEKYENFIKTIPTHFLNR